MEKHASNARPGYRTVFALAFAVALTVHLLIFSISPMVHVLMDEMQLSHAQFGLIFSAAMVSLILFRLPWGGDLLPTVEAMWASCAWRLSFPLRPGLSGPCRRATRDFL
ncbi:hypothetical protein ACFLUT_01000 [Chloroflexota bacterium]